MQQAGLDLILAELLSARLCHELVSPVGAISNGVEILEDEPGFVADATKLIGESAKAAARRLQFYRVAYGSSGPVTDERARSATLDLFADGKVGCDWPAGTVLPEGWQKLACNLLLLAAEALPRGGRIALKLQPEGIAALANGRDARLLEPLPDLLASAAPAPELLSPRTVQAAFTAALARRLGARIELGRTDEGIVLAARAAVSADAGEAEQGSGAQEP